MSRRSLKTDGSAGSDTPGRASFGTPSVRRVSHAAWLFLAMGLLSPSIAAAGNGQAAPVALPAVIVTPSDEPRLEITSADLTVTPAATRSTARLSERVANLHIATNDAHSFNDTFALRGLTNTPIFGAPAVAVYLDDMPLSAAFTVPANLGGFTRVTLHRGSAQTTRFGRAGSAGVLTLHTPEPGAVARGELRATFGNFAAFSIGADAASAQSPKGDAYVSAQWTRRDGYIDNVTLGEDIDDKDARSVLARARFRPRPETELTLLVTGLQARDGVQPLVPLGGDLFQVDRTAEGGTHVEAGNLGLGIHFPVGELRVETMSSASVWRLAPYRNTLAFGPAELGNEIALRQQALTQEIRVSSPSASAVKWHAGLFVARARTAGAFAREFGDFTFERSRYEIAARDAAMFAEIGTKVRNVELTAGLRAEVTRRELDRDEQIPVAQRYSLDEESSTVLPRVAARMELSPRTHARVAVGGGYKPGGFSAFTGNRTLAAFGPERSRMLEVDLTHASADRKLAATMRLFHYAITGYQIERSFATGGPGDDYLVVSAPEARSQGGEIELTWKPAADWLVAADLGTTEVTLREFTDPYTGTNLDGSRAPYVPDFDASVRVDYRPARGFFAGIAVQRDGQIFYTEDESEMFAQAPRTLWSAHCGYTGSRTRVTLFAENIGDERYYRAISPGTGHGTPGAPRTLGAEIAVSF